MVLVDANIAAGTAGVAGAFRGDAIALTSGVVSGKRWLAVNDFGLL